MELLLAPAARLVMPARVSGQLPLGRAAGKGRFSSPSPVWAEAPFAFPVTGWVCPKSSWVGISQGDPGVSRLGWMGWCSRTGAGRRFAAFADVG